MKTKYYFLSLVFAAFLSSSMPFGSHSLEVGKEAPLLNLSAPSSISLDSLKGKYVVVNFWSAADPQSRVNNRMISKLTSTLPSSKISVVSICTDNDSTLQAEIMAADGIPDSTISLSAAELAPEVLEDFQTSTGNRCFLIDTYGNLRSISPSLKDISDAIG